MARARQGGEEGLELRLLGPLEAASPDRNVALGGPKPRALLAVLALDVGRVVSVDRLVECLWPGEAPETAAHAVQVYVSQLRKALGPVIATRAPGYVLEFDTDQVDTHRFVRLADEGRDALQNGSPEAAEAALREALGLWRGPALADFLYEPFAQTEIARLEELRTIALEERIDADLALARHAELVAELEALVQAQPLRERPRGQLMLALYRSARQADALSVYRDARETLVEELGLDPGPELKELEAAILRQDDSLLLEETPLAKPPMQFRRLVTILFVDIVESMALAETLDAEALGRVLQSYFESVSAAITRHGGAVEKYAGDAVMAAFGIPVSHEDDALRAARAALDVRASLAVLNERLISDYGVGIEIRIGIESGEVVATPTDVRQRLVTGEAVGIASKLEGLAESGQIVVGELAGRLIDHAAELEPLGALEIKGKREPVRAYRLVEIAQVAPAFASKLDAPLVGRKRELAALRKALKRTVDGGSARAAVVIGSPGVGKSRLVTELTRRAKGVTTLWGRCLSYGDGITYWPLRDVLGRALPGDERDAVLAALDADTPPPAPEIAWLFRRFCEALAREQPLLLVLDDIHWAEPTFLELVEHVVSKGEAPILVVCIARDELLEDRPAFLEGLANVDRIVLEALSAEETNALLDGLGGTVLESDQRARIVAAAEGNPFFVEQLLALGLEGGLTNRQLPETIQALLAARLDRLGPGERAVLERASVIGKRFRLEDVVTLLDPEAAPTADAHVHALIARGFIRPVDDDLRFRHVLVQEAVYRAAPKRLRAELHERFTDQFGQRYGDTGDVDEFAGYHLEQAYRLRTELGESDRRTERLAEDAGRRLGAAGTRAWRRNDEFATVNLLGRATSLLQSGDEMRRELLSELSIGLLAIGETEAAERAAIDGITTSEAAGDRRREMRARLELACLRMFRDSSTGAGPLLDAAGSAIPIFEAAEDHRGLGRALLLIGYVHGVIRCRHRERQDAAERALIEYRAARLQTSSCLGEIAASLYHGPEHVSSAIERCAVLQSDSMGGDLGRANVLVYQGGLESQRGEFTRARELIEEARAVFDDLGQLGAVSARCRAVLGDVELLAGDASEAESVLTLACDALDRSGDWHSYSGRAADLAEALLMQGRLEDAESWTHKSMARGADAALPALVRTLGVRARLAAARHQTTEALTYARDAIRVADQTDARNVQGRALMVLSEVLHLGGSSAEAAEAAERASRIFSDKGNMIAFAQAEKQSSALAIA